MKSTLEEISAGGVVYRVKREISNLKFSNSQIKYEFLIGKHSGYHKWVLPKGLVERGESQTEAAVREVEEEVGVKAQIVDLTPIKSIEYFYFADLELLMGPDAKGNDSERRVKKYQEEGGTKVRIHKKVFFYLMESENDLGNSGWEMEERKWVSYKEGMELLAFPTEKEVFEVAWKVLGASDQS